jgi:S1-C subfamily serine protease
MYRITGKQLILLSIISAFLAGSVVAIYDRYYHQTELVAQATNRENPANALPDRGTMSSDEQNNIQVYETVSPGVVNITSTSYVEDFFGFSAYPQSGTGSGSIIDSKGHILTNFHVVQGAQELKVTLADKSSYDAQVVGADPDNDLAVIKIDAPAQKLHVVKLGSSQKLSIGQKVLAIGNPFGLDRTLTRGIISGLGRPLKTGNGRTVDNVIQTDASINPGNSGGPLLNSQGELIGVNTAIYSPSGGSVGIGFAVPVDIVRSIVPDLIEHGRVLRPWLGIQSRILTSQLAGQLNLNVTEGLLILGVVPDSPADRAGLIGTTNASRRGGRYFFEGDILTKIGDTVIRNQEDMYRALNNFKSNDMVIVEISRNGRLQRVNVQLQPKPASLNR